MVYNVGQVDLLKSGVIMPSYTVGSLEEGDYPCNYTYPDLSKKPQAIPLGSYDKVYDDTGYAEPYEKETQHTHAKELSDLTLLSIMGVLLLCLIICTYLSFKHNL